MYDPQMLEMKPSTKNVIIIIKKIICYFPCLITKKIIRKKDADNFLNF